MKDHTLLDTIGWNKSDLNRDNFVTIDVHKPSLEICFRSRDSEKILLLIHAIDIGDLILFPNEIKYMDPVGEFSLNPLNWLLGITVWMFEWLLTIFSKYKRLSVMESSLRTDINPSNNLDDFPFGKWLKVVDLHTNYKVARLKRVRPCIALEEQDSNEVWFLDFPVFSFIGIIGHKKKHETQNDHISVEPNRKETKPIDASRYPLHWTSYIKKYHINKKRLDKAIATGMVIATVEDGSLYLEDKPPYGQIEKLLRQYIVQYWW